MDVVPLPAPAKTDEDTELSICSPESFRVESWFVRVGQSQTGLITCRV